MTFVSAYFLLVLLLWGLLIPAGPLLQRLLARTANWTAKFRYRDYLPVVIVILVGIGATAIAGDAFVDLAESVHAQSPRLHALDEEVHSWARTTRTSGATAFFVLMTNVGTPLALGILVAIVTGILMGERRWRWAAYLVLTTGIGALLNLQLKAYFARARPELADALRTAHGYSFPSGHAMGSMIVFGSLAYLTLRSKWRWRRRAAAVAVELSLVIAIAASRIYLGVHWISDVGAGLAAGLLWTATTTVAYETFRRIRLVRSLRTSRRKQTGG